MGHVNRPFGFSLHVDLSMWIVGVVKWLLCCVGIMYNLGLGVYLANFFFPMIAMY